MAREEIACPFCGFKKDDAYAIQLHIEEHHTEDSPFMTVNSAPDPATAQTSRISAQGATSGNRDWIKCTRPRCNEYMSVADIQEHLNLHEAIDASEDGTEGTRGAGRRGDASKSMQRSRSPSTLGSRFESSAEVNNNRSRDTNSSDDSSSAGQSRSSGSARQRNRWEGRSSTSSKRSSPLKQANSSSGRSLLHYFSGSSAHGGRPPLPPRPPRPIEQPRQPGRLGTKELGPHAFEKTMPAEVRRRLLNDALPRRSNRIGRDGAIIKETFIENETAGLIPVLADLCGRSRTTESAYFCHRSVCHINKIRCDGNFCGYWNIQMMSSFLADDSGSEDLLPNVLEIQDTIEQAWDNGICTYSRVETGGIRGSRKWIGTHDALAYFTQKGVSMQALAFKDEDEEQPAILSLLDHLEAYFMSGAEGAERRGTSLITDLPPVYFQRAGHSMTIVGLERKSGGHRNLIIFDPSFGTTRSMDQVLDGKRTNVEPHNLLKPYRRSDESLSRWREFEALV